jgi:hypothetical protein
MSIDGSYADGKIRQGMAWTRRKGDGDLCYTNSCGDVVAFVRIVGIRGSWRWRSPLCEPGKKNPGCGTTSTEVEARNEAEAFLKKIGAF